MLQRLSRWTRRGWLAQIWITPFRQVSNGPATGLPSCPVCGLAGALPGTPVVVSNPDGSIGATLTKTVLFICQQCGCLFAGFTT